MNYCFKGMSEDTFRSDSALRLEISQQKFRFRTEATGRDVERMISDVPESDRLFKRLSWMKGTREPGEAQASAPVIALGSPL